MVKIIRLLLLFLALTIITINVCPADEYKRELMLVIPETKTVSAYYPRRVAISNPDIADIGTVTENDVMLIPKSPGKTTLAIWDKMGRQSYAVRVTSDDLNDIKLRIDKLIGELGYLDVYTKVSKEENKILLLGSLDSDAQRERFDNVLVDLKPKTIDLIEIKPHDELVQIDVEILEISKSALENLGFTWTSALGDSGAASSAVSWTETADGGDSTVTEDVYNLGGQHISRIWERGLITAQLNLILSQGKGRVLSRPKLVCLSGKEANFLVGGEIPIVTVSTVSGGQSASVEYKEYGISLGISPVVKPGGFIQAALKTQVSEVDWANAVTASGIKIPAFSTREAETEIYLKENNTVFLAGLIKNKESENYAKLPALGDLPILGALFRSKDFTRGDTELVISLTPRIVKQEKPNKFAEGNMSAREDYPKTLLNYIRVIQDKIGKAVVYPEMARNAQGDVLLGLHILSDGRLLNVIVNKSSGNKILDMSSVNIVKSQAPFAPFPAATGLDELWIDIPIHFKSN